VSDRRRLNAVIINWVALAFLAAGQVQLLFFQDMGLLHPPWVLIGLALVWIAFFLRDGLYPVVEPTGRVLGPVAATGALPRTFRLVRAQFLHTGKWSTGLRWLRPRLVLEPGLIRFRRTMLPGELHRLWPMNVVAARPLLSRRGKPGIVLDLYGVPPVFFFPAESRETVLSELAAAGFRVDGTEQVVGRHWARR
jgi:hypothetical protein